MKSLKEREVHGMIRPVHKARIAAEKVAAALNLKHPEPMSLMHKREKQGEVPPIALPRPEVTLGKLEKVALSVAAWDKSNPFAYGRAYLHAKQGFIQPEETIKEMDQRTLARKVAKAREVEREKSNLIIG